MRDRVARRILVRTLSFLLIAVAGITLVGCPAYYAMLMAVFGWNDISMGEVVVAMTLRNVSEPLTYYQDHMADAAVGTAEYSWGVQIDLDDDVATGDAEGFDVVLTVALETGGDSTVAGPLSGLMVDLLPDMTVTPPRWNGSTEIRRAGLSGNTLYIESTGESIWYIYDPVAGTTAALVPTFRARFFARYNDPPDPGTEVVDTVELIGNGTQSDPAEDVSYAFIDIVEVRIENAWPEPEL